MSDDQWENVFDLGHSDMGVTDVFINKGSTLEVKMEPGVTGELLDYDKTKQKNEEVDSSNLADPYIFVVT